ncbi:MAG TPA: AarF/ABC1/UbiB kinase family protein [Kofleriaceae bacterium]|jgi:ubiquinone biosynthesis protein
MAIVDRLQRTAARLDALSLDLARDGGAIVRDARALAGTATTYARATPRMARIAQGATALFARQRWLRLAQAARSGAPSLRAEDHRDLAKRAVLYAAELRGGIAKLGQLASCRPDLIGPIWAGELAALQADVPPIETAAIRTRVEAELGRPIGEVFADFADAPLAAASLAQVHCARLLDGTDVVVKVQVPGIETAIAGDIAALRTIASACGDVPGVDLPTIAAELSRALDEELDYEAEAAALVRYAGGAIVPRPIAAASSRRVLTMTRIEGERLASWLAHASADDRDRVLGALVSEIAEQILVRGEVHADPHPGNFLVTADGRLALLDFGCTLALTPAERAAYARLVLAVAAGDHARAGAELATLGFRADDPDQLAALAAALVGALRPGARVAELDWQAAFADQVAQARTLGGLVIPRSFVLLGRVLAALAGLLATYKPRLELHPLVARAIAQAAIS